jgi:hypothetical protein
MILAEFPGSARVSRAVLGALAEDVGSGNITESVYYI